MGGGGGKTQTVQQASIPGYLTRAAKETVSRAKSVSERPWEQYKGQGVAGLSDTSKQAIDLVRSSSGEWRPTWDESLESTREGGKSWLDADAAAYMNPYQKTVTDIAAREMLRNAGIAQKGRAAAAVDSGAFGSAQAGVQEAAAARDLQQNISDTYAKGQAAAFENAQSAFNADRAAKLQSGAQLSSLAGQKSDLTGADYERLMGAGAAEQQQKQNELDWAYNQWKEKRDWDWNQISRLSNIVSDAPSPVSTTSTSKTDAGNQTAQMVGAGVTVAATVAVAAIAI